MLKKNGGKNVRLNLRNKHRKKERQWLRRGKTTLPVWKSLIPTSHQGIAMQKLLRPLPTYLRSALESRAVWNDLLCMLITEQLTAYGVRHLQSLFGNVFTNIVERLFLLHRLKYVLNLRSLGRLLLDHLLDRRPGTYRTPRLREQDSGSPAAVRSRRT